MKNNQLPLQLANKVIIWVLNPTLVVGNFILTIFQQAISFPKVKTTHFMKKYFLPILALCVLVLFSFFSFKQNRNMSSILFSDYDKAWEIVDSLERKGLPESALKHVEAIVSRAKNDDNAPQLVKALLYRGKFQSQLKEDGLVHAIAQMETEIEESDFPAKPILQSIQAELYNRYTQQNSWKLKNRKDIIGSDDADMQTWSMRRLLNKSRDLYLASVADEQLKSVAVEDFKPILEERANAQSLRPTLFDLLAHRAIDFFQNERNTLTEPAYKFHINQAVAFAPVGQFINTSFETKDQTSTKYQALLLLQEVLAAHINDQSPEALIDADLKRLQFVYSNAILDDKKDLYINALEELSQKYTSNPATAEVLFQLASLYQQTARSYQPNPENIGKWDLKRAYELAEKAIAKYPDSYGAQQCKNLLSSIATKRLELEVEQVNLPNQPILTSLFFRNIEQVYVKVVELGYEEQQQLERDPTKKVINILNKKEAVHHQTLTLPREGDFHSHRLEFDLGALPLGNYAILVADNEDYSSENGAVGYTYTHISNLAFWSKSKSDGQLELTVMDRNTGEPLEDVIVELYSRTYQPKTWKYVYNKTQTIKSDKAGYVIPSAKSNGYFQVKLIKGNDVLYLGDGLSNHRNRDYQGPTQLHTHFFLDRAIYRPGQTVHFKGIVIQKEVNGIPSIVTNKPVTINFMDANHQPVKELELVTNEYGTISGTFTTPKTGLLGQMSLKASVGGQHYFAVEEYKRPKFEVTFDPIKGSYRLEDTITIEGKALAFAGSSIDNSEVQYRVVRQTRFPFMPYWFARYNPYRKPDLEITSGVTRTDENGQFAIQFKAIPDPTVPADKKPEFTYRIIADITDITGETQSSETRVSVGYVALSLELPLPEKVDKNVETDLKIVSQNLAGEFEPAKGKVIIESLVTPQQVYKKRMWEKPDTHLLSETTFKNKFGDFAYKNENEKQHWPIGEKIAEIDFNTLLKNRLFLPTDKMPAGNYRVTLASADKYGTPIEIIQYIEVYDLSKKKLASNQAHWVLHPSQSFEPGQEAVVSVGSALAPIHALVEVEKGGKIVQRYWKEIKGLDKIEFLIKESDRGNFYYHISFTKDNRTYQTTEKILVPWSNKDLKIEYATFRDKLLPGQEEEWQLKISGPKKEKIAAEMVATMYDASLDEFTKNDWLFNIYPIDSRPRYTWQPRGFKTNTAHISSNNWQGDWEGITPRIYPNLNWFGFYGGYGGGIIQARNMAGAVGMMRRSATRKEEAAFEVTEMAMSADAVSLEESSVPAPPPSPQKGRKKGSSKQESNPIRTNLAETVFFMPHLKTDAEGNVIVKFKMNEALTRWKFLGLAHTKDLEFALTENEVVTQKELMVQPNPPRFFREGDVIEFTAKVSNLSEEALTGSAEIELLDALTMQPVNELLGVTKSSVPFSVAKGESAPLSWTVTIPKGKVNAITHRVIAKAGNYSDGEENALPVLSNRMLVTESKPLALRGKETKTFTLESLANSASSTLQPHQFTLEFTSNPAWYGVQALPYLMEYPYDCTEQIFNRFYANTLATTVANAHPKIQDVFTKWKADGKALQSNLSKNQELKSALLEETPWVLNAQSEEKQKQNIALLFDLQKMADEQATTLNKIKERQLSNGGFAWFPGGRDSWYVTQYLVEGMGHLKQLGALGGDAEDNTAIVIDKAVRYIDDRMVEAYAELKKRKGVDLTKDHLSNLAIHYLYARSFFMDRELQTSAQEAFDYYVDQSEKYWLNKGVYQEGMIGLALHRINSSKVTTDIIHSLKERAIKSEELGMYWKQPSGYFWYQLPIEAHSIMIELFQEVAQDEKAVNELKIWLLKNKQTNHWKTTKATSAVVYALLMSGDNWLTEQAQVNVTLGKDKNHTAQIKQAQTTPEAGTGYFKTSWQGEDISADMAKIKVRNPNKQPAWGAVYWQYFEDLDKIKTFEETPLTIQKELFKVVNSDTGPKLTPITEQDKLTSGDKVQVRIEIRVDRPMEYVHLKDTRAAGLEPINVLSHYKIQGGLGYYESTKDASTNFFIDYLPRGTYVFEYPLRATHKGNFSNGITSMQCMYAPEFSSHSEGIRVTVE